MTAEEWRTTGDPQAMLTHLRWNCSASDRKYRLFACACCRRIWHRFPDDRNRALVAAVEDFPDGLFEGLASYAISASSAAESSCQHNPAYWVAKYLGRGFYKFTAEQSAALVACKAMALDDRDYRSDLENALYWSVARGEVAAEPVRLPNPVPDALRAEAAAQADLMREVFGNPFRPVHPDPNWRSETALAMAKGIYTDRAYDRLLILADALEEAGCDDSTVLNHCRGDGPHALGCWVVDRVLDKE